ncbi:hypothetical protein XA68_18505 [Ophiocordyceps unilateralis]|uniref:Uncharacterized protein n=1 Tax=Ophiocordyceps unilateralis TaxID=268505 RepID=A0A2A9P383_OPHUN|nr:hypothetical protein XA68_18505 [Ophiocordyceps unilateralis]
MADQAGSTTLTIVLATVVPTGAIAIAVAVVVLCWWLPRRRRRRLRRLLFRRAITSPVDDEEIASWKTDRSGEKKPVPSDEMEKMLEPPLSPPFTAGDVEPRPSHRHAPSAASSSRKPPSLIVYQTRLSEDQGPASPPLAMTSTPGRVSVEVPVLARAPNARPGLTDEAIQGEEAFVCQARRQPSRLAKAPPPSRLSRHSRSKSSRATMSGGGHQHDLWYGQRLDQPRRSADQIGSMSAAMIPGPASTSSLRSSPSRSSMDEEILLGGLSPRPLISKSDIGRAIG